MKTTVWLRWMAAATRLTFVGAFVLPALRSPAVNSVNSWINAGSGVWEISSSWSLGVIPDQTQSIMITNAGWKAVAIGTNAAQKFPQSMQIQDLQISSPTNSYNTLLMNFSGLEVPLQTTSLTIGPSSAVVVQGSSLDTGSLSVGGSFNQGDYSQVKVHGGVSLSHPVQFATDVVPPGAYFLTNGTLSVGNGIYMGGFPGPGQFVQYGGLLNVGGSFYGDPYSSIYVSLDGEFDIYGGQLTATNGILVGSGDYADYAYFYQYGGSINADTIINGNYTLNGGNVTGHMQIVEQNSYQRVNAFVLQTGGTNHATSLELGYPNQFGGGAFYTLSNGVVRVDSSVAFNGGRFSQYNGQNTIVSNFVTQGRNVGVGNIYAEYFLSGGNLSVGGGLTEQSDSHFTQSGGTNLIAGDLALSANPPYENTFYILSGGTLAARNISIGIASYFQHTGGNIIHSGILTLAQGTWYAATGDYALGLLQLGGPNTNSTITFPSGSSILRLASSSSQPWASGAILSVTGWHGSSSGGGASQLYFGSNSSGLTAQQLAQVQFQISGGTYPAAILSTGEVVPASLPPSSVNSWINPGSGIWEDSSSWSLGVRPNQSQSVMITNAGSKSVAINGATRVNFPDSMTVSNLAIRGSGNTTNTLLLNNFGTVLPLTVSNGLSLQDNGLTLRDNGQIVNFNSGLVVQGGTIIITNSQIAQNGGFIRTTNTTMILQNAAYNLTNGLFEGGHVWLGIPTSARFNQYGGTAVISDLYFGQGPYAGSGGNYALYGGSLSLPGGLTVEGGNSSSSYLQAGGTNRTTQVAVFGYAGFTLEAGLLADSNVEMLAGDHEGTATINQSGGTHVVTNTLSIIGGSANSYTVLPATYNLNGGTLSAGVIELDADQGDSVFVQSNATTFAGTVYAHSHGYYGSDNTLVTLAGGSLSCSNYTAVDGGGCLNQTGGALVVSNLLDFGGARDIGGYMNPNYIYGTYTFTGGTLTASNINITGNWVIGDSSTNRISNPGFFSLSHTLQIGNAVEQLGPFILSSSSNATINLAGSASRLSFANSSGQAWAGGATLVVTNWNGNLSGGGAEQLKFGTSQSGLTPNQLAMIQFTNPAGLPAGNYPARILATGEVVPSQLLTLSRSGNTLTLTWGSGWFLQSSTNVGGPYQDVQGATSPYTAPMNIPRQFFRLRQ